MNRHGIVNLVILIAIFALLTVTTAIVAGSFYAPDLVRDFVGNEGYVAAVIVLFGMFAGGILFHERIYAWLYHRYELSDQSPDHRPEQ